MAKLINHTCTHHSYVGCFANLFDLRTVFINGYAILNFKVQYE